MTMETAENTAPAEERRRIRLPLACKILYICAGASLIIYVAARISEPFADFFCRYVASGVRAVLAWLTAWLPFSLGEATVLLLPVAAGFFIHYSNKYCSGSWRDVFTAALMAFSVVAAVFTVFVFTLGTGYRGSTLDKKLDLDRKPCSAAELYDTAVILGDIVNEKAGQLTAAEGDFTVMPYGYAELSSKLCDAYAKLCDDCGFIQRLRSPVKPVMLSEPWTYTHITGVYTFFTGEANINTNMPDYTIPYTAAHELAHQRGIAREDEANFVAFLACMSSDDPYIQYSGALSMYEYVINALYSADRDLFSKAREGIADSANAEMNAYNRFFEKYRKNVAATVSGKVNDTYLKSQGQSAGSVSYGLVVDLAVAWYRPAAQQVD
jgi:hypothetical protein